MPTIKDIAKLAGVTYVTVSRALNNAPGVNVKTRQKILEIAKELNYVPNVAAKRLVNRDTKGIGLIWPHHDQVFFYHVCNQIQEEASKRGFTVMVSVAEPVEALRSFQKFFIHRVIHWMQQIPTTEYLQAKEAFQGKILEIQRKRTKKPGLYIDRRGGIIQALQHLVQCGHEQIAFIGAQSEKWLGYSEGLVQLDLEFRPELAVLTQIGQVDMVEKMERFLDQRGDTKVTAVIVDCYHLFKEFAKLLNEKQIRIPEDLSLIVYDDLPETQSVLAVPITTAGPNVTELAQKLVDLIVVEETDLPSKENDHVIINTYLTIRQSTRKINQS